MPLSQCRECGGTVSTEAIACPHCGIADPAILHPSRSVQSEPAPTGSNGAIWWWIGVPVALVIFAGILSSGADSTASTSAAATSRSALDAARARDSVAVQRLLTGASELPVEQLFTLEERLHHNAFPFDHDSAHSRFIRLALDSVSTLVRKGPDQAVAARTLLRRVEVAPGSAAEKRKTTLDQQVARHERTLEQRAARALAAAKLDLRKSYARDLERRFLDDGMNIRVVTRGNDHTTLRITYVLVDRVWAHQMSKNGEMFSTLRQMGFKRLELRDGYDESYYWDL